MWSIWLWVYPSEVHMYLWMFQFGNIMFLTTRFFDVAKFTILTPLLLLSWYRLSFSIVSLIIFSLSTFALKSLNRIFMLYLGKWWKPATSQNYIWHPITNKLTLLTADTILWCTKNPLHNWWFPSPYPQKKLQSPVLTMPPVSHLTSCRPTTSNLYLVNFLASVAGESDLYWF